MTVVPKVDDDLVQPKLTLTSIYNENFLVMGLL